jgi:periplasmic protein CpxP/Spy
VVQFSLVSDVNTTRKNMKKTVLIMMAALLLSTAMYAQEKKKQIDPNARIEKRSERMKEVLALNDDQYAKVKELNRSIVNERMKAREKADADKNERRAAMKQFRESHDQQLRQILSDDQWNKWQAYKEQQRKKGRGSDHKRRHRSHRSSKG